jgi:hypothetical protein
MRLELFADWNLASHFVEEVSKEGAMVFRLPIQNSLKNAGSLTIFRAGGSCGGEGLRSAGPSAGCQLQAAPTSICGDSAEDIVASGRIEDGDSALVHAVQRQRVGSLIRQGWRRVRNQ